MIDRNRHNPFAPQHRGPRSGGRDPAPKSPKNGGKPIDAAGRIPGTRKTATTGALCLPYAPGWSRGHRAHRRAVDSAHLTSDQMESTMITEAEYATLTTPDAEARRAALVATFESAQDAALAAWASVHEGRRWAGREEDDDDDAQRLSAEADAARAAMIAGRGRLGVTSAGYYTY